MIIFSYYIMRNCGEDETDIFPIIVNDQNELSSLIAITNKKAVETAGALRGTSRRILRRDAQRSKG